MNKILKKDTLNPTVIRLTLDAPAVARHAEPGQFVIVRSHDDAERIPLTIAGYDREKGTVDIIFQLVGEGTLRLSLLNEGDMVHDVAGPLGRATETDGIGHVAIVGGGVGCAIAYPVAKKLHDLGAKVDTVIGFRSKDLVILEEEFRAVSDRIFPMSDDGSWGEKGLVTDALRRLLESGEKYDKVITIGPLIMMKFVCALTKEFNVPTIASMNPIMIDGTGMCGGCRLSVGGKTVFACVDGPDFDGHQIDFDQAMIRNTQYREQEKAAYDHACNLLKGGR
ncbi:MAG: sulfide/dihydroorotate dehydrogenase-like FAD/NAD-binding protein [Clostridia bacterium]|nr:sulfide/dihydroorotate dehydrogenase-like FAD/NAD-binding protein [Clostridia bacterium]